MRPALVVDLAKLGEVDVRPERPVDSHQVGVEAVAGELHPVRQSAGKVADEDLGVLVGPLSDKPRRHQLRSASMAVKVHTSPQPNSPSCSAGTFFALALQYAQTSSTSSLLQARSVNAPSWYSWHAWPRSTRRFATVFLAAPVIRTVDRIDMPSTRQPTICAHLAVDSLFIGWPDG